MACYAIVAHPFNLLVLRRASQYHPQTDGQTERTIQTLEDMLQAYIMEQRRNWD